MSVKLSTTLLRCYNFSFTCHYFYLLYTDAVCTSLLTSFHLQTKLLKMNLQ